MRWWIDLAVVLTCLMAIVQVFQFLFLGKRRDFDHFLIASWVIGGMIVYIVVLQIAELLITGETRFLGETYALRDFI